MATPKYTFLLPAFKGKYLDEMLRSIKAQTYTDFKVLISDDCSPEDLRSICEPYLRDPRFSYRRNEENMGSKSLVSHWNLLVDMCDTEYLIMASDDDVYEPQFLAEIDVLTQKYPNVDLYRGRVRGIDDMGNQKRVEEQSNEFYECMSFIHRMHTKDFVDCVANYCYRTKMLQSKNGFVDFPLAWFSDEATNFFMSQKGCVTTPSIVFSFRSSDISITGKWGDVDDSTKKMKAVVMYSRWMREWIGKFPQTKEKSLVERDWRGKVRTLTDYYIYNVRWKDFIKFLMQIPNDAGFCKFRMLAHYINAHI